MTRYRIAPGIDPRHAPLLTRGRTPHVCPNGHAMDEGYLECPCCGAYRAARSVIDTARCRECGGPLYGRDRFCSFDCEDIYRQRELDLFEQADRHAERFDDYAEDY